MSPRYGFVQPEVERLYLKDVHTRALEMLRTQGVKLQDGSYRTATAAEIDTEQFAYEEAVEADAWIDVKKQLTAGETRRAFSQLIKEMHFGERPQVNAEQLDFAKISEYVVGWWLKDADGRLLSFDAAALQNVNVNTFNDISAAVDWHEAQQAVAAEARKNEKADTTKS